MANHELFHFTHCTRARTEKHSINICANTSQTCWALCVCVCVGCVWNARAARRAGRFPEQRTGCDDGHAHARSIQHSRHSPRTCAECSNMLPCGTDSYAASQMPAGSGVSLLRQSQCCAEFWVHCTRAHQAAGQLFLADGRSVEKSQQQNNQCAFNVLADTHTERIHDDTARYVSFRCTNVYMLQPRIKCVCDMRSPGFDGIRATR